MTIGEKIKEIRLNRGLKQSDLAEKSGLSRVAIGNYERNDRTPGTEQVERLAAALGVSPVDLIGWGYYDAKSPEIGEQIKHYTLKDFSTIEILAELIRREVERND